MTVFIVTQLHCDFTSVRKHQVGHIDDMKFSIGVSKYQGFVVEGNGDDGIIISGTNVDERGKFIGIKIQNSR